MPKLSQILAIEKGKRTAFNREYSDLHKATQKPDVMNGHSRTFKPSDEDGEHFPPENKRVQFEYGDVCKQVAAKLTELFDVTATKDWANCSAKADVMLNGETFLEQVPVTHLLFLEKQLTDLHTFVDKMAELDPGESWTLDPNTNHFRSEPVSTHKTKKLQVPIVLHPATPEHPAQTQLVTKDVIIGYWETTKFSGAIPKPKKKEILERIETLSDAVKFAREQANSTEVDKQHVGAKVLKFVFPQ
jgi:hypothetical protein